MMNEAALVADVLRGRKQAFAEIIRIYQNRLFAMAMGYFRNPEEAKDVTQEIFLAVYGSLPRYDPSRPFRNWLLRIATHHCIQHLRQKTRPKIPLDPPPPELDPLDIQVRRESREQVRRCLDNLDEEFRTVVQLYYFGEQSCQEIADTLEISLSLVKIRLMRARRMMAQAMKSSSSGDMT